MTAVGRITALGGAAAVAPSPAERATETSSEDAHAQGETPRMSWARLLKRVFDIDLEHCPTERLQKPFAALRPSGPVQQWIFHQAEKELTTLPGLRYSSGHRKGRLKILSIRWAELQLHWKREKTNRSVETGFGFQ